jgi:hypothetical protein
LERNQASGTTAEKNCVVIPTERSEESLFGFDPREIPHPQERVRNDTSSVFPQTEVRSKAPSPETIGDYGGGKLSD